VPEAKTPTSVLAVIPARFASTRLPAKALAEIGGKPMVVRVLERARTAKRVDRAVVATDDQRIYDVVAPVGEVVMTSREHASGSDRVAEVAATSHADIIVNVQGDLPLLDPAWIDALVERLMKDDEIEIATPAVPVASEEEFLDPNAVKVVVDRLGRALYFSRAPIPVRRDSPKIFEGARHHVGIYAYRRETLLRFAGLPPTPLEESEKLEQLRALEFGIGIGVVIVTDEPPLEVDTPADLERARKAITKNQVAGSR
jgi:3-deoxy-manno-octulosonate cytidylyltransferase (CMP-KDO synthetase)